MSFLTGFLVRKFIKDFGLKHDMNIRSQYGVLEAWTSIVINFVLFIIKIILGVAINSVAIIADAIHTLSDIATSGIVLFGFITAKTPPDPKHPYGHGRAESIATLIIAVLLIVVGVEFIHVAIDRFNAEYPLKVSILAIIVMLITVFVKEWMARFSKELGKIIGSDMLEADAWHHRSDAITSGMVVLALLGAKVGYYRLDAFFSLGIAGFIIWAGFHMAKTMVSALIGEAPPSELVDQVITSARKVDGVLGIHGLQIHDYGVNKYCSVHIEVSPELHTDKSHEIADSVEDVLRNEMELTAVVHVDIRR